MTEAGKPKFVLPAVQDNAGGWGPCNLPTKFKDIPYQPFSKADKLGKAADFTGTAFTARKDRYGAQYGAGADAFSYYHEDESQFQLVDTVRSTRPTYRRGRFNQMRGGNRRELNRARDERRNAALGTQGQGGKHKHQQQGGSWQRRYQPRRRYDNKTLRTRDASVDIKPEWEIIEDYDFVNKLNKQDFFNIKTLPTAKDIYECGKVETYDKKYDQTKAKKPKALVMTERTFHKETTTQDEKLRKLIKEGNVFATDAVLAVLMTAPKSVYSWDIIIEKVKGKLFLDKRDNTDFDCLTVSETAKEPPQDDNESINSAENLGLEATMIDQSFSQQCLITGSFKDTGNPNHLVKDKEEASSVIFRYRKWNLGDDIELVARTEVDAFDDRKNCYGNVKACSEWSESSGWMDKIDSQGSTVLVSYIQENAAQLARWTVSALLAGSSFIKLGFVTREKMDDNQKHKIIATMTQDPEGFANQISLNMPSAWSILKYIILQVRKQEDGKYLLLKDPSKGALRLYRIPENEFESDEEDNEENEDGEED